MTFQLARRILSVLVFLLAVFIIFVGISSTYIAEPDNGPGQEPWTGHAFFAFFFVASVVPFLGSYILWPK